MWNLKGFLILAKCLAIYLVEQAPPKYIKSASITKLILVLNLLRLMAFGNLATSFKKIEGLITLKWWLIF